MQHKILAIAEEEGVRQAAYSLKLLQSDGELTMASTGKDEATGDLVTKKYKVKGPVMLMLTTTAIDVDEELMNRCLVLTVNESREQTRAIHERQRNRQTLAGLLAANSKQAITALHQNAQRLLKTVLVVNPYADQLTFLDDKTRMRRDHMKYLTLIRAVTLLHQHQRPVKEVEHGGQLLAYIEVTKADIALANTIAHEVLGRTLDELPPQTRRLLSLVYELVQGLALAQGVAACEVRFTRREVREALKWGDTQLKLHLSRLADLEYLMVHRRGTTFEYELMYDGNAGVDGGGSHLSGLINATLLDYDSERSGVNKHRSDLGVNQSGGGRPNVGPMSGGGRGGKNTDFPYEEAENFQKNAKTQVYGKDESRTFPAVNGHPSGRSPS
jgi:post-segregation antitoxin (ccd killing protein)